MRVQWHLGMGGVVYYWRKVGSRLVGEYHTRLPRKLKKKLKTLNAYARI